MPSRIKIPPRLFKYRAFDSRLLGQLVDDELYFAEPSSFNDPLDTRPEVDPDLQIAELEWVLEQLTTQRISAELKSAAQTLRYRGPKTLAHIESRTRKQARRLLDDIAYSATDPEFQEAAPVPQQNLLARAIGRELLRQHERGVFSLAARWDSPLMWSHYADQHRGVCVGYSVHRLTGEPPLKVRYGGNRLVTASRVKSMLEGDLTARADVDRSVLLKKARDWDYEKEWRLLRSKGLVPSPLELEEVIFGLRCTYAVKHAIRRALAGRDRPVKFFEVHETRGGFELKRSRADDGPEYQARRSLSMYEDFEQIDDGP